IGKNKDIQRQIEEYLTKSHSMPHGKFIELVANPERSESIDEEVIAVYLNAIFKVTNEENYEPSNYFSSKELKKIDKYEFPKTERLTLPYTIRNVLAFPSGRDFITFMSYQELAALWNSKIITYN